MKNRKLNIAIKSIVSIGFFVFLTSFVQGHELLKVFANVNWFCFLLSFLLVPVMLIASCLKWKVLLDAGGQNIPFFKLIAIYLVGYFFSNLLPSTVGGDVARTYYAGKEIKSLSFATVTVFIERFSGLLFLLVLVIVAPLAKNSLYSNVFILFPALCSLSLLLALLCLWTFRKSLLHNKSIPFLRNRGNEEPNMPSSRSLFGKYRDRFESVCSYILARVEKLSHELVKAFDLLRYQKGLFAKVTSLTVLFYFLTWVNVYVAFLAFGTKVDFFVMVALVPTIMFVAHLPVTLLGNFGFFESVFVFYFLFVGIPGEATLAMGLLLRLKMFCLGGLGFVVYLFYQQVWGRPQVSQQ